MKRLHSSLLFLLCCLCSVVRAEIMDAAADERQAPVSLGGGIPKSMTHDELSRADAAQFARWYQSCPDNEASNNHLFTQYHLYQYKGFLVFVQQRVGYEPFMLRLAEAIQKGGDLARKLRDVPGFRTYRHWGFLPITSHLDRYGFHQWVIEEAKYIMRLQELRLLPAQEAKVIRAYEDARLAQCEEIQQQALKLLLVRGITNDAAQEAENYMACEIKVIGDIRAQLAEFAGNGVLDGNTSTLALLASQLLEDAIRITGSNEQWDHYQGVIRAQAILQTLQDAQWRGLSDAVISDRARQMLEHEFVELAYYEKFEGSYLQLQMHREMAHAFNRLALLCARTTNLTTANIRVVTVMVLRVAFEHMKTESFEYAFACQDLADSLIDLGNKFLDLLGTNVDDFAHGIRLAGYRALNTTMLSFEHMCLGISDYDKHMAGLVERIVSDTAGAATNVIRAQEALMAQLGKVARSVGQDEHLLTKNMSNLTTLTSKTAEKFSRHDCIVRGLAFVFGLIAPVGTQGFVSARAAQGLERLKFLPSYSKAEFVVAQAIAPKDERVQRVLMPLSYAGSEVFKQLVGVDRR